MVITIILFIPSFITNPSNYDLGFAVGVSMPGLAPIGPRPPIKSPPYLEDD